MQNFRTLTLAKEYYQLSKNLNLPPHLKDQFLRSASSIALNLAEGNAKTSEKEKFRFYEIAHGSFRESIAILDLENIDNKTVREKADHLGASLFKLTRAFMSKKKSNTDQSAEVPF